MPRKVASTAAPVARKKASRKKAPRKHRTKVEPVDADLIDEIDRTVAVTKMERSTADQLAVGPIDAPELGEHQVAIAKAAGLNAKQVIAAVRLGLGYSNKDAAAAAGVQPSTLVGWRRNVPAMASFVNQLTLSFSMEVRSEAMREILRQISRSPDRKDSEKDILDWIKLALSASTEPSNGRGRPTIGDRHQHVHFHGDQGQQAKGGGPNDSANLIALQKLTNDFNGGRKRRLSALLRESES